MPYTVLRMRRNNSWGTADMDLVTQLLLLIVGGLFSGVVITSIIFYRQIKREKTVSADHIEAKTDVLHGNVTDGIINRLVASIGRLTVEQDRQETEIVKLRSEMKILQENMLDLGRGAYILTRQLVEANLEPAYIIPNDIAELLKIHTPKVKGRGNSGG